MFQTVTIGIINQLVIRVLRKSFLSANILLSLRNIIQYKIGLQALDLNYSNFYVILLRNARCILQKKQ